MPTEEQIKRLVGSAERVEVLMDALALTGIGSVLPPQYREDWAVFHTALIEALKPWRG